MVKRTATPDSDDDGSQHATPPSKRAKMSNANVPRGQSRKTKGKSRRRDDESDEDEQEDELQEDDAEFEDENREAIMAAMEAKRGTSGVNKPTRGVSVFLNFIFL
jgi:hypothetical protein